MNTINKREELRTSMLNDLENRGLLTAPYIDKVDEYMSLWDMAKKLDADIEERGVYLVYQHGANQSGTMENKSLAMRVKVSSQMLNIWSALGFRDRAVKSIAPAQVVDTDEL